MVLIITILAIIGPEIAPKDPAEEINITMIEGEWYIPPFDIGTPGYPLGSDSFGRDLYSRLLWGIRPTMIMVVIVASVRLILGVIIGLSAGWFSGITGRSLNGLIQVALALPVLLVALGAIAIVGVELGIWAFIIGLSLTGWVDTALQVREQTRIVKGQVYVEAASAMGASNKQILSNHILKQIIPMLLMLFAFEISSTLMLTAGLGFLGYYIGGDVWVETDDFVARRISGAPELGQMLATSWVTLTKPWAMVVVGTTVFITVLGFNLIGEGLRQNIGLSQVKRRSIFDEGRTRVTMWVDDAIWHPLVQFFRIRPLRLGLSIIAIFFLLSFGALFLLDVAGQSNAPKVVAMFNQRDSNKTQESADPQATPATTNSSAGTQATSSITYEPEIAWEFVDESGFSGGPALAIDESQFYIASQNGSVYTVDFEGQEIWQLELETGAVGTPAVDPGGDIYISDKLGGLTKISPQGELLWRFQTQVGERSHSGPAVGSNGAIYYTVGTSEKGFVQAVSPDGNGLWVTQANTPLFYETPIASSDGEYIFLKNDAFKSGNGEILDLEYELDVNRFFSGANGLNYLVTGHKIIQWEQVGNRIETVDIYEWDSTSFSDIVAPRDVGVNEADISWQLYTTPGGGTNTVWVDSDDSLLGMNSLSVSGSTMVVMNDDLSSLVCGGGPFNPTSTDCALIRPDSEEPVWKAHLGNYGAVSGGIYLDGLYYLATEDGYVFELDENLEEIVTPSGTQSGTAQASSPANPGIQWSYQATDEISSVYRHELDGNIYLTTNDGNLHILNPNGEVENVIQLPAPPFHQTSSTGRSLPFFIEPVIFPDGTILVISADNTVYTMDADGQVLWEETLESIPAEHPLIDQQGNIYIIDNDAALLAFDKNGLLWRFQPSTADIPAHGKALDADGNIYYVITDYSKGYIQSISRDGQERWVTEATTIDFYDQLEISPDGEYLALAENLVLTENGELVDYANSNETDAFIFAENGQNFMRALHTVRQWQLGPSGLEILSSGIVSEEDTTLRPPLAASADSNGIVWLYYPERYVGGGIIIVWMSPDGELLGNHLFDRSSHTLIDADMERSLLTECRWFDETESIDCSAYSPTVDDPLWTVTIPGVSRFSNGFIDGEIIYLFGENDELISVFIGEPRIQ